MDKSMANGNGPNNAMGQSSFNGPPAVWRSQGWDIRPCTSWVLTIGQDPA